MLAVQQAPVMAADRADRSPSPFLPFGYSIDPNQEPPMDPPPEPPSGMPILSEHDSKFLSSFFDDITADQYNMPSFGEGLNFSDTWLDLPPQFMGTATSFGGEQQAGPSRMSVASPSGPSMSSDPMAFHGSNPMAHMMPPPPPSQQLQHAPRHHQIPQHHHTLQGQQQQHPHPHSDEVLNAAATLLNNNQAHPHPSNHADMRLPQPTMGPPVGHLRHQGMEEFQEDGRRNMAPTNNNHESAFADDWMMSQQGAQTIPRNGPSALPTDFQWGSDSNFSMSQRYTPDANRETVESQHREQLKLLDGLEVNKSADNTRPSSPSHAQNQQATNNMRQQAPQARMPEEADAPPRKRRKSKINRTDVDDEEDETTPVKASSRRKSKVKKEAPDASPGVDGKKRKGAVNGSSKAARENLSEEQKRENHIRSEQKRRTLIKEGFDDLCEIVPALRTGGYSKSTMLNLAASWLEELLDKNDDLEKQLADLGGGEG